MPDTGSHVSFALYNHLPGTLGKLSDTCLQQKTGGPAQGGDVDNGGSYAYVETGGLWEISVPSNPFCCEPKTALKK